MTGASEQALFVEWIYETSQPLLHPFQRIQLLLFRLNHLRF